MTTSPTSTPAGRAIASVRDQQGALRSWLDELAAFGSQKHALADVLDAATRQQLHDEQYDAIIDAIGALLDAGRGVGVVRDDVTPADLLALVAFLWRLGEPASGRVPHLLDLVVDGLRPDRG